MTAGAAAKLAFMVQPASAEAGGAISPAVQVMVQDASGNTVSSASNNITLGLGSNPAGGTLSGTTTVAAVNGVATFNNLTLDKPGTGYTLTAAASGMGGGSAGATSAAFNVTVGGANRLVFSVQPTSTVSGSAITPAVQVAVQDAAGNPVSTATNSITLAIGTNPGGGTLSGTKTVAAVNGVATFSNLSINNAAAGYTLTAAASAVTGATSSAFTITSASAGTFHWETMAPPAGTANLDFYHVSTTSGQVWASGSGGTIIHYTDGGGWEVDTSGMTGRDTITGCPGTCGKVSNVYSNFMWTYGAGSLAGVAVGGDGMGLRYYFNGSAWTRQSSGTSTLMSVIGVGRVANGSPAHWWACGRGGITYRGRYPNAFQRFYWDTTSAPVPQVSNDLNACGGTDTTDVFAAGSNGFLAHFDGNAWAYAPYNTNTTVTLNGITHCGGTLSATDWWLVGDGGVIRHATAPFTTFTEQASGTSQNLYGIDAASCTDVYAVGWAGTILHYNGTSWVAQSSGTGQLLASVVVRLNADGSFRDAWAVGHAGTILHGVP